MKDGTGFKWAKVKNGIGYLGIIYLDLKPNDIENEIVEDYSGRGYTSQGNTEEVGGDGYNSWKEGVRNGLKYAFSKVDSKWTVTIQKLEGLTTDTNPTIAGYVAMRAFWDKCDFNINSTEINQLENFVFSSWCKPYQCLIPDFFNLSFSEFET
jgi:hypothetical protein